MIKIDLYTKFVLTIIAGCLLWICVRDSEPVVSAQSGTQRVVIAGVDERVKLPISLKEIELHVRRGGFDETINTLPISITEIHLKDPWGSSNSIDSLPISVGKTGNNSDRKFPVSVSLDRINLQPDVLSRITPFPISVHGTVNTTSGAGRR